MFEGLSKIGHFSLVLKGAQGRSREAWSQGRALSVRRRRRGWSRFRPGEEVRRQTEVRDNREDYSPPPIKIRRYFYASSPLPFSAGRLASAGDEEMLGVYMEVEAMAEAVRKSISK